MTAPVRIPPWPYSWVPREEHPQMQSCWVLDNTSPEFGNKPPRLFATREGAMAAGRQAIEDYRRHHLVCDEIDEVLRRFNEDAHAGDDGALFYVNVFQCQIER